MEQLYWFTCPGCKGIATIDEDQKQGRVSILCSDCGYHETQAWPDVKPVGGK